MCMTMPMTELNWTIVSSNAFVVKIVFGCQKIRSIEQITVGISISFGSFIAIKANRWRHLPSNSQTIRIVLIWNFRIYSLDIGLDQQGLTFCFEFLHRWSGNENDSLFHHQKKVVTRQNVGSMTLLPKYNHMVHVYMGRSLSIPWGKHKLQTKRHT